MKTQRFILLAILGATIWACSRQGEGERCVLSNANADCESGLECTPADKLADTVTVNPTERCCPPDGNTWSDARCDRRTRHTAATGGASATGGATSSGSDLGAAGAESNSSAAGGSDSEGGSSGTLETAGSAGQAS
jgi:hypothetical protein